MKLTIAEIYSSKGSLVELAKLKMPVKASLAVVKLINNLDEHYVPAKAVENKLIAQYGKELTEGPNKGQIAIRPGDENWPKFTVEYNELMGQEVEVVMTPILLPAELEIEPNVLIALERFVRT